MFAWGSSVIVMQEHQVLAHYHDVNMAEQYQECQKYSVALYAAINILSLPLSLTTGFGLVY